MEYASNGKANTGVALGAVGTGLGVLSGLGSIMAAHANTGEEAVVTRHELNYVEQIAGKDHTIAKLEAQQYTDAAVKGLSDQIAVWKNQVDQNMNAQAVLNATTNGTLTCIQSQLTAAQQLLNRFVTPVILNTSVMPGWGDVTITPSGAATVKGAVPSSNG